MFGYQSAAASLMIRGTGVEEGSEFEEHLKFIHAIFFSASEMAMRTVIDALIIFEERCK